MSHDTEQAKRDNSLIWERPSDSNQLGHGEFHSLRGGPATVPWPAPPSPVEIYSTPPSSCCYVSGFGGFRRAGACGRPSKPALPHGLNLLLLPALLLLRATQVTEGTCASLGATCGSIDESAWLALANMVLCRTFGSALLADRPFAAHLFFRAPRPQLSETVRCLQQLWHKVSRDVELLMHAGKCRESSARSLCKGGRRCPARQRGERLVRGKASGWWWRWRRCCQHRDGWCRLRRHRNFVLRQ